MAYDQELANVERRNEQLEEALHRIRLWCEAYPIDVFPEPDLKRAREVLEANGMTLGSISAHAMRHVVTKIAEQLRGIAV